MREWQWTTLLCEVLMTAGAMNAAHSAPDSAGRDNARQARFALGYDPAKRCPEVRTADAADAAVALVVFRVGPSGVPSEPSMKSSSGSAALDAAAQKCVLQLRFLPVTSWGEGTAVASWQQMAWRWANPQAHPDDPGAAAGHAAAPAAAAVPAAAPAGTAPAGTATAGTATAGTATGTASTGPAALTGAAAATGTAVGLSAAASAPAAGGATAASAPADALPVAHEAEVRVCVDAAGKLAQDPSVTHSSGDVAFDRAAVKIARSGSGYYPLPMVNGKPVAGCVRLAIRSDKG
jgi:outer membrane biosynthesis protein TonB